MLPLKIIIYLIPISIFLGAIGLAAFLWSFRSGQYQDMDGAAERVLLDEDDRPDSGTDEPRAAAGTPHKGVR